MLHTELTVSQLINHLQLFITAGGNPSSVVGVDFITADYTGTICQTISRIQRGTKEDKATSFTINSH